ncbi:Hypothetical protein GL50581_3114 [Giardia duodenalis ATCC 50581]|uniref:Uncharacterized protein n=1 Tax=Giardia intestinalis (strain ATCC 50581 / GS clone H7) TaxID=598745 RepID=C6LWF6_GIAIB|nr:Hypothetical protein GL50581_3114 [Giardia intestinalis ATCC 50581]
MSVQMPSTGAYPLVLHSLQYRFSPTPTTHEPSAQLVGSWQWDWHLPSTNVWPGLQTRHLTDPPSELHSLQPAIPLGLVVSPHSTHRPVLFLGPSKKCVRIGQDIHLSSPSVLHVAQGALQGTHSWEELFACIPYPHSEASTHIPISSDKRRKYVPEGHVRHCFGPSPAHVLQLL